MTMPSYIINWEDILTGFSVDEITNLIGSMRDLNSNHRIVGVGEHVPKLKAKYDILCYRATKKTALMDVSYAQSSYSPLDYWELWVDGDRVFETVYVRELGTVKHWETVHYVNEGQIIRLVHHNNSGTSKDVWADLGYAGGLEKVEKGDGKNG